jgi:AraC-like DNA-binding protein
VEHAQRLMLATDAPLSQIALDCGLADQAHFSRLFRRFVGESPRSWRRARVSPAGSVVDLESSESRAALPGTTDEGTDLLPRRFLPRGTRVVIRA